MGGGLCVRSWMGGQRRDLIFGIFLPVSDCRMNLQDQKKRQRTWEVKSETLA